MEGGREARAKVLYLGRYPCFPSSKQGSTATRPDRKASLQRTERDCAEAPTTFQTICDGLTDPGWFGRSKIKLARRFQSGGSLSAGTRDRSPLSRLRSGGQLEANASIKKSHDTGASKSPVSGDVLSTDPPLVNLVGTVL